MPDSPAGVASLTITLYRLVKQEIANSIPDASFNPCRSCVLPYIRAVQAAWGLSRGILNKESSSARHLETEGEGIT